jgi:hypothetical protein
MAIRIDLAPVDARLGRAAVHVAALEAAVGRYVAIPPYRRTESVDHMTGAITVRAEMTQEPPAEIALILSDAVHQLRAALDNLVGCVRPGGPTGASAFPITTEPVRFDRDPDRKLEGVPDWAVAAIREIQPFPGDGWQRDVGGQLLSLHDLARLDRHRAPRLVAGVLVPDWATGTEVRFRGDRRSWAETIFKNGEHMRANFAVTVHLAEPEFSFLDGFQVPGIAQFFSRLVRYRVVEEIRARAGQAAMADEPLENVES